MCIWPLTESDRGERVLQLIVVSGRVRTVSPGQDTTHSQLSSPDQWSESSSGEQWPVTSPGTDQWYPVETRTPVLLSPATGGYTPLTPPGTSLHWGEKWWFNKDRIFAFDAINMTRKFNFSFKNCGIENAKNLCKVQSNFSWKIKLSCHTLTYQV